MSFLADRYLLFNLEGRKTDKCALNIDKLKKLKFFLNNVLWASLKRK